MGLDMYAYAVEKGLLSDDNQVDFDDITDSEDNRHLIDTGFAYWRKFNHLHGWMENLYYHKGGSRDSFNCAMVRITLEDLDNLRKDATGEGLKPTEGFFFGGVRDFTLEDTIEVLQFIVKAREAILEGGKDIVYTSWW